jgi:hypothetical protein
MPSRHCVTCHHWHGSQRNAASAVHQAADDAVNSFRDAVARLGALPRDEVVQALTNDIDMLAARVRHEADNRVTEAVFAEAMASGLTSHHSDTLSSIAGLIYLATQWDLDPAHAHAILARFASDEVAIES